MERLGEYAQEESPNKNKKFTQRSYTKIYDCEILRAVRDCKRFKNWNGVCKAREWKDSKGSRRAESNPNGKILN